MLSLCGATCPAGHYNTRSPLHIELSPTSSLLLTEGKKILAFPSPPVAASESVSSLRCYRRGSGCAAALTKPPYLVAWGSGAKVASTPSVASPVRGAVPKIASLVATDDAFAAIVEYSAQEEMQIPKRLISWGNNVGLPAPEQFSSVVALGPILASPRGFAAETPTGTIVWGHDCDNRLLQPVPGSHRHHGDDAAATQRWLRAALAWADARCGGAGASVGSLLLNSGGVVSLSHLMTDSKDVLPQAYAAITNVGRLFAWGSGAAAAPPPEVAGYRFVCVAGSAFGFVAVSTSGVVFYWGNAESAPPQEFLKVSSRWAFATNDGFALLALDGTGAAWIKPRSDVLSLQNVHLGSKVGIQASMHGFAIHFKNETYDFFGKQGQTSLTSWWLRQVVEIYASSYSENIAAVLRGGETVTWRSGTAGGGGHRFDPQCEQCKAGKFSNAPGSMSCDDCEKGFWSPKGASKCRSCILGLCQDYVLGSAVAFSCLVAVALAVCLVDQEENDDF